MALSRPALVCLALLLSLGRPSEALALEAQALTALLKQVDEHQRHGGDSKTFLSLEQKEKQQTTGVREAWVFRRDERDQFMVLFLQPRGVQGRSYLWQEKGLWSFTSRLGLWARQADDDRLNGTELRRSDLAPSRLAEDYAARFEGEETLGSTRTYRLHLQPKARAPGTAPVLRIWVDPASFHVLKRQSFSREGLLLRTVSAARWQKVFSAAKGKEVWYPQELHLQDEVEKAHSTFVRVKSLDLRPLEANTFTKAWLESQSR